MWRKYPVIVPPSVALLQWCYLAQHWTGRLVDNCGGVWCVTLDSALALAGGADTG